MIFKVSCCNRIMKKEDWGDILKKGVLKFKNNKELEKYYEKKWGEKGYKKGYALQGINISKIYHKERSNSAYKFLKPKKEEVILDAGCGEGKLSLKIAKKCGKIYAVDISSNAFKKTKEKSPKNLIFKKMNIENLKFKEDYFDKIVCVETLEHVLNPKKVLKEFSRVLKRKGTLVITYPILNKNIMAKVGIATKTSKYFPVSEHLNEWGYKEIIKNVNKKNFIFIKAEGIVFNLGKLGSIKKISKYFTKKITNLQLSIKRFPRNSLFITLLFEKI